MIRKTVKKIKETRRRIRSLETQVGDLERGLYDQVMGPRGRERERKGLEERAVVEREKKGLVEREELEVYCSSSSDELLRLPQSDNSRFNCPD